MPEADRLRKARIERALRWREAKRPTWLARIANFWTAIKAFLGGAWTALAAIVLNVGGALILAAAVVLLYRAVTQPTIAISPIAVPEDLVKKGFTPEVVAMHLRTALTQIIADAKSAKETATVTTRMETPDIVLPHSGLSTETIAAEIRELLGVNSRWSVTGDITTEGDRYALDLKITNGKDASTSRAKTDLTHIGDLFPAAARNILEASDPYQLAALLFALDPDRTMQILRSILARYSSGDAEVKWAHTLLGELLLNRRDFDEAIAECNKAIALDRQFAPPHVTLGHVMNGQGKTDAAIEEFSKAIEFDPQDAYVHNDLAGALYAQRKTDAAIAEYDKAIAIDPRFSWPHNNLGNVLKDQGKIDAAIAEYNKAIAIDPRFAAIH